MDKWETGVLFTSRNIMRIAMYGRTFNPLVQHTKANYLAWLHRSIVPLTVGFWRDPAGRYFGFILLLSLYVPSLLH